MVDYKLLFSKVEESIKKNLFISEEEFSKRLQPFLEMDFRKESDKEIFWIIVYVNFFSGIRAAIIERKLDIIKSELYDYQKISNLNEDEKQRIISKIGFPKKCGYCFKNARYFQEVITKFGSFKNYLKSFNITDLTPNIEKIERLRNDLKNRFYGLGPKTVNHLLSDLGFNVLKPDRVICRIFFRLGLIDSNDDINGAIREGKLFEKAIGKPIRYVDIIFVKYGQIGRSEQFGTKDGICLEKNPKCQMCNAKELCNYYRLETGNPPKSPSPKETKRWVAVFIVKIYFQVPMI